MIYTEPIIALVRNTACVLKDLLSANHILMKPIGKLAIVGFAPASVPLPPVSILESIIAPLQFAAVVYNFSAVPYALSECCSLPLLAQAPSYAQWAQAIAVKSNKSSGIAVEIAKNTLAADVTSAKRMPIVMLCKLILGVTFAILTLLSLHVPHLLTSLNWILLLLELALLYLLYLMAEGVADGKQRAADLDRLANAFSQPSVVFEKERDAILDAPSTLPLLLPQLRPLRLPTPPWRTPANTNGDDALPSLSTDPFGLRSVAEYLHALSELDVEMRAALSKSTSAYRAHVVAKLRDAASRQYYTSLLDGTALLLNGIAFVGYAAFPIAFFGPSEQTLMELLPIWPGHECALTRGNLLGDVAWTIESVLMLLVPPLIAKLGEPPKAKAD